MVLSKAWARHASSQGLTTANCQWIKQMSDWLRCNFSSKYKTYQIYDLSRRVLHYLQDDLHCLAEFDSFFGERSNFQHEGFNTLNCIQNLHVLGKVVANFLTSSYSAELLSVLFMEAACFMVGCLVTLLLIC